MTRAFRTNPVITTDPCNLGALEWQDGRPRTLILRPTSRSLPTAANALDPTGTHFLIKLTIRESLGPGYVTRVVHIPWVGGVVLLGGKSADITAQLIAPILENADVVDSELDQWVNLECGLRDGSPQPFEHAVSRTIEGAFAGSAVVVDIPTFASRFSPYWPTHNGSLFIQQLDAGDNELMSAGVSTVLDYGASLPILPAAARLRFWTSNEEGHPSDVGALFHGYY